MLDRYNNQKITAGNNIKMNKTSQVFDYNEIHSTQDDSRASLQMVMLPHIKYNWEKHDG